MVVNSYAYKFLHAVHQYSENKLLMLCNGVQLELEQSRVLVASYNPIEYLVLGLQGYGNSCNTQLGGLPLFYQTLSMT